MYEGWRWRYSREAELAVLQAAVIGNRIPLNEELVDMRMLLKGLPHYVEN